MFFKKKPLKETEFAEKFAKQLLKKIKGLKITLINELEVRSEFNGGAHKHFLDNCYSEYIADTKSIKKTIEKYIVSIAEIYLPKEFVKVERILPIIKDKRFVKSLEEINVDFRKVIFMNLIMMNCLFFMQRTGKIQFIIFQRMILKKSIFQLKI